MGRGRRGAGGIAAAVGPLAAVARPRPGRLAHRRAAGPHPARPAAWAGVDHFGVYDRVAEPGRGDDGGVAGGGLVVVGAGRKGAGEQGGRGAGERVVLDWPFAHIQAIIPPRPPTLTCGRGRSGDIRGEPTPSDPGTH
ncbi:exported protein of unknown function [Candidatus Promineifilum breve]|uniref:Uncharacterized protein n=1 Tax=Candidatus Promineifilum breve TaxID=1806508 RepID=A0A160T7Z6_9CHLR|nr:exported protein of unknown function [Candidatus Promineifilum breve]